MSLHLNLIIQHHYLVPMVELGALLQSILRGYLTKMTLRQIDVKFNSCRFTISNTPGMDVTIPLPGIIGPTGWLRTLYVDDKLRITHGHKGSVFILFRTAIKI